MSKYTTEVRYICESITGQNESQPGKKVTEIITAAAPKIFDFDYPLFDSEYRLPLEIKILRHYYTREISEETFGLWKLKLEDKLNLIMPYYNQLYKSALLEFNPLYDVDYTRTYTRDNNGTIEDTQTKQTTNNTSGNISEGIKETTEDTSNKTYNEDITHNGGNKIIGSGTTTQNTKGSTTGKTDNTETGSKSNWGWNLFSDTPQGGVDVFGAGPDGSDTDGFATQYLTNATKTTSADSTKANGIANSSSTNNQDLTESTTKDEQTTVNDKTGKVIKDNTSGNTKKQQTRNNNVTNNSTTSENGNNKNVTKNLEEYTERVQGKQNANNYADLILKFRETFLNIDKMIIEELQPLFFGIW